MSNFIDQRVAVRANNHGIPVGLEGVICTNPTMTNDGDWLVLVRFDNAVTWRSVDIAFLETLP